MYLQKSLFLVLTVLRLAFSAGAQTISTAAGSTTWGGPTDVALDTAGNMYLAGLATNAELGGPLSVVVDADGTIYIAEYYNMCIRPRDERHRLVCRDCGGRHRTVSVQRVGAERPGGDQPIELTVDGVSAGQNLAIVIGQ